MNIITGEKIQMLCDHFIGLNEDFNFNPKIRGDKRCLELDSIPGNFNNKRLVYVYTHVIYNPTLYTKLKTFQNKFDLVLHNSDAELTEKQLKMLKEIPNIEHIYSQNVKVKDKMVTPLPIGIANSMWVYGNLELWGKVKKVQKIKHIHFQFNIATNNTARQECYDKVKSKGIPFLPKKMQLEYINDLNQYKYAICPDGNGVDTHRLWECLYLRVIPICTRSISTEYFSQFFPIILLDDWSELDLDDLEKNYETYNKWDNVGELDFSNLETKLTVSETKIDVVIPYHYKDSTVLEKAIISAKKNVIGCRRIYIIGNKTPEFDYNKYDVQYIPEETFPFKMSDVNKNIKSLYQGWYLQQMLKLCAFLCIPTLSENYLILDSDTIILKKIGFIDKNGRILYGTGTEWYMPYFHHMERVHPDFKKYTRPSGISHHMMFNQTILREIKNKVEILHSKPFWDVFFSEVNDPQDHGCSEYELYFNYIHRFYPEKFKIRALKWTDSDYKSFGKLVSLEKYDFVSYHCRDYF